MSESDAKVALPKALGLAKGFYFPLLQATASTLPVEERAFSVFLERDLPEILTYSERYGIDKAAFRIDQAERRLASCVPFAQYADQGVLNHLATESEAENRKFLGALLGGGLAGMLSGASDVLCQLVNNAYSSESRTVSLEEEIVKRIADQAAATVEKADRELVGKPEEMEEELGPAQVRGIFE